MEFDLTKTVGVFAIVYGVLVVGTVMSPMAMSTVMMVLGGLLVFGLATLFVGIQYGEYRATSR